VIRFAVLRLLLAIPVLLAVLTISFWATVSVPGDPLAGLLPENPTAEQYQHVSQEFGLDRPRIEQWLRYVERTAQGDLGRSIRTRRPVADDLKASAAATLELALTAFVVTMIIGVLVGVVSAAFEDRPIDHLLGVVVVTGSAAPAFWIALMLQVLFYSRLDWLPAGGRIDDFVTVVEPFRRLTGLYTVDALLALRLDVLGSALQHLVLPAAVLSFRTIGIVARITRTSMSEALTAPYTRTARAFGARERRIVTHHAFRNAALPVVTVLGLAFGELLTGSILVETVFNWPGLGLYTVKSIVGLDFPGVIGVSLLITLIYVIANLVVDLLYPLVDPRLRGRRA
jgi:peptide/nickel transport system permease protein